MQKNAFHSSVEGAQHGPKGLAGFAAYAKQSGAFGLQPSNYMVTRDDGSLFKASEIREVMEQNGLVLNGISRHCPFWLHGSLWTGTRSGNLFVHPSWLGTDGHPDVQKIEDYLIRLFDLDAELDLHTAPMFWGQYHGPELAGGYPWGFWTGPNFGEQAKTAPQFDLLAEGDERFVTKTARLRSEAVSRAIRICHEIHPGTGAQCADDFLHLVKITDNCKSNGVNADGSHCWEGEGWEDRFTKVGPWIYAAHIKDFKRVPGAALRSMIPGWPDRGMRFTLLGQGEVSMLGYAELLIKVGYLARYCAAHKTASAPLVVEAESAHVQLDTASAHGIKYVNDNLTWPVAEGSFEKGMGAAEK